MSESRSVLEEQLVSAAAAQFPVRIARNHQWWADDVCGFVVSAGEQWVVVQKLMDSVYFDGYEVLSLKDLTAVEDDRENGYIERAVRAVGRPPVDFDLASTATTRDVLKAAAEHSTLVSVYVEKTDENALLIGHIARHGKKKFDMQLIGPTGVWTVDTSSWRYKDVTRIAFGSRYDAALERFGDPRPVLDPIHTDSAHVGTAGVAKQPDDGGDAAASPITAG